MEWTRDHFAVSTDRSRLQTSVIYEYLTQSTWAAGIDKSTVEMSIKHSLCFGLYTDDVQIGFARFVTDYATFAYMSDVFVLDTYKGQGLGRWLVTCMLTYPEIQKCRRVLLATTTANGLYEKIGFTYSDNPQLFMNIFRANIYK